MQVSSYKPYSFYDIAVDVHDMGKKVIFNKPCHVFGIMVKLR